MVTEVMHGVDSILGNTDQIASASDDLSRRTEQQGVTLEESASALDELLTSVKSAADNAAQADWTVKSTREMVRWNGEVMTSAVSAMGEIEKSSGQFSEIISVIDNVAFQTNLLALNAGVEAARAGETCKGFAVLVSEVRKIVQRSAEAAAQIKELIDDSTKHVHKGVRLVESAGEAIIEAVQELSGISDMVTGLASKAMEQSQCLNDINVGVTELDTLTQHNTAMAKEVAAAAQSLRHEAGGFGEMVRRFQVDASKANDTQLGATMSRVDRIGHAA